MVEVVTRSLMMRVRRVRKSEAWREAADKAQIIVFFEY